MNAAKERGSYPRGILIEAGKEAVRLEADAVGKVEDAIGESFADCVDAVLATKGKIISLGSGTSATVARRMAHLFSVSGTPAVFIHPMDALHGSVGAIEAEDLVFAFSKGGESAELNQLCELIRKRGSRVVAVTETADSTFARLANIVCVLETSEGADPGDVLAMGSTLVSGVWTDALARVLMRVKEQPWEDTLEMHPAGAVGQRTEVPRDLEPLQSSGLE